MKKKSLKYEKPVLRSLINEKGMDVAFGPVCSFGSQPGGNCQVGNAASGRCRDGTSASGGECRNGTGAVGRCRTGSSPGA